MEPKDYIPYVRPSDIPEAYRGMIELIGLETFMDLCQCIMGDEVYIPKPETIIRRTRDRMIVEGYTGSNEKELAKKFGLTTKQIANILIKSYTAKNTGMAD